MLKDTALLPLTAMILCSWVGVTQLAEYRTFNARVGGSNPPADTSVHSAYSLH